MSGQYSVDHSHDNPSYEATQLGDQHTTKSNGAEVAFYKDSPRDESVHVEETCSDGDNLRCGLGSCVPDWLQVCNRPWALLVWLSWFAFVQGFVVNGINNVNTVSVERRFELTSSQVSLISSAYDISAGVLVLPVTYYATYAHQPRLLAIAALVMAVGSFVMSIPHFVTELYQFDDVDLGQCDLYSNLTSCGDGGSTLKRYLGVFIAGQFLHGFGGTSLYSVGIVLIDTSVAARSSPLYQGIFYAFSTLGPALGYIMGGFFLGYYVDVDKVDTDLLAIDSDSPSWVGAWWVGFLLAGVLAVTVFCALLPYPRELPSAAAVRAARVSQVHADGSELVAGREGFGRSLRDLPTSLKLLLLNPVNMLVTLAAIGESFTTTGIATFLPKIIQFQFNQSQTTAAYYAGGLAVVGSALGMFLGGLIPRAMNLKLRGSIVVAVVSSVVSVFASLAILLHCPESLQAGTSVPYPDTSWTVDEGVNLTAQCNAQCHCGVDSYLPLCSPAGLQYFSPCHAGCPPDAKHETADGEVTFTNCSCVLSEEPGVTSLTAVDGRCETGCWQLYVFLPLMFVVIFTTFMQSVPGVVVALRCIPETQRSFGMGVRWVFVRFLGSMLGPIVYGALIDSACLVWSESCGERGACWTYHKTDLSTRILAVSIAVKIVGLLSFTAAYFIYKPPPEPKAEMTGAANPGLEVSS